MTRNLFVLLTVIGLLAVGCKPNQDRSVTNTAPANIPTPQNHPANSSSGTTTTAEDVTKSES